ncbi:UDP-N-acetylmuramoyl-L-alanyl-D-glutamate--2,6-diaminopimelate ligase [Allokutzneria sp. A3M-2-11 16]|uniref:UDP-N-acetylmuramoyl-L-alanyl-D-glutamate--2, 6-diaminopimelate ligase n=1 Tax=Allokutzneria sp. A3M-2-11 16 TaxID=2962043 RepID=UPI0020B730AC|nr:UDP-N-acetylmuramoyl-L-alanyl-D-glutamate--2,6-diaminopimelate ligase [Allokutzneria sp. A3M-2-11 16]MCP3797762.1 UDP-N-acetylmuramoyl-L-alanyl-D-glutamate--2,6-diaminopimelate ligase [Allokutzneria sp. A3M-2-11 16]
MSPVVSPKTASAPPRPSHVEPVGLSELAALADARLVAEEPLVVSGATLRAQHVRPGDLFAALPGANAHGADFAEQALAAGAVAVLTDEAGAARPTLRDAGVRLLVHEDPRGVLGALAARIYGDPSSKLAIVGVTGTSGKTTVTTMIGSGLRAAGRTTGLIGTVQTVIAGERLDSAFTTPEAPDLQALFAVMVERGVTHVAMEVSSHALALGRAAGTRFAVGAFTNLSQDHLDFHADMEDYFQAKAALFDGRAAKEVVCVDNEWGHRLVKDGTITVSLAEAATWRAEDITVAASGAQSFRVAGPDGIALDAVVRLPGIFNVSNAVLAIACAHAAGVAPEDTIRAIGELDVPGRMERVNRGQDFVALVDYSHKPAAVSAVLDTVRDQIDRAGNDGRVIVVLGCGGDRDRAKRPIMGEAAVRRAELTVVTDDNPRGEEPATIRAAMVEGALAVPEAQRGEVVEIGDRRAAIQEAVRRARPGDVVVVAGKGHETGQEIAGVVHPFDDRHVLADAIDERFGIFGKDHA